MVISLKHTRRSISICLLQIYEYTIYISYRYIYICMLARRCSHHPIELFFPELSNYLRSRISIVMRYIAAIPAQWCWKKLECWKGSSASFLKSEGMLGTEQCHRMGTMRIILKRIYSLSLEHCSYSIIRAIAILIGQHFRSFDSRETTSF